MHTQVPSLFFTLENVDYNNCGTFTNQTGSLLRDARASTEAQISVIKHHDDDADDEKEEEYAV